MSMRVSMSLGMICPKHVILTEVARQPDTHNASGLSKRLNIRTSYR